MESQPDSKTQAGGASPPCQGEDPGSEGNIWPAVDSPPPVRSSAQALLWAAAKWTACSPPALRSSGPVGALEQGRAA